MPIRKKHFPCGHSGKGQVCHTCLNAVTPSAPHHPKKGDKKGDTSTNKAAEDTCLGTDLSVLPHASHRQKARAALLGIIRDKKPPFTFGGKRMTYNRRIISVPIGRGWRLLIEEQADGSKVVRDLLSHEAYNRTKPGKSS